MLSMGKSTINGPFSIAMFVYQSVDIPIPKREIAGLVSTNSIGLYNIICVYIYMVGGFNPSEKYESVGIIIPNMWKNKTCSKPPTRYIYIYTYIYLQVMFSFARRQISRKTVVAWKTVAGFSGGSPSSGRGTD